ncbi:MAG: hypothetical protein IKE34_08285 [Paenibacillus sp.]|nr:hypothetical protein [Paenibacillus sp.]
MMNRNLKQLIDTRLSNLRCKVDPEAVSYQAFKRTRTPFFFKKPAVLALSMGISLIVAVPVMAAHLPSFQQILGLVGDQIGVNLRPIQLVSIDQGMKMEVIAAMNDDETAIVYLTLQDMEGGRIDDTVDLYDYSIQGAHMFTQKLVAYEAEAKKATFQLLAHGAKGLNGKKVTLRLSSLLSGKQLMDHVDLAIDLQQEAARQPATMKLDLDHIPGAGGSLLKEWKASTEMDVLQADHLKRPIPGVEMAQIVNIGFVDDRLHVKTKWKESVDDNGYLYLLSEQGEQIFSSSVTYSVDKQGNTVYGHDYIEYVFNIGPNNISKYQLYGHFVENHNYIEGNWNMTFEMEAVDSSSLLLEGVDIGTDQLHQIKIQPLGITIVDPPAEELDIQLIMKDGTVQKYSQALSLTQDGDVSIKYLSELPIQIEQIAELRINQRVILLTNHPPFVSY